MGKRGGVRRSIYFHPTEIDALEQVARAKDVSVNYIVRLAVNRYLKTESKDEFLRRSNGETPPIAAVK